ncbi:MAG: hypothetical protein LBS20_03960 [Prevotella sp.]|jgi:hypothetical protein|nr:hypothetical protein [Prevotella sp.]
MKLENLIDYLINPMKLNILYKDFNLNLDSEAILIYMQDSLNLESKIFLFEIEETEDYQIYKKDNIEYIQLFPVDYAIELINEDLDLMNKGYSNLAIAERLLQYRINDA